jgi:rubrerythrin
LESKGQTWGNRLSLFQWGRKMDEKRFNEVLRFAIEKEIATHNLYVMYEQVAKYSGAKELFAELAEEEEQHRRLLEHVPAEKVFQGKLDPIPDLRISDYLIDVECQPDSSYAEILRLVMKNEEHSFKLYNDLKESCIDKDLKRLFEFLAHEEAKHKLKFEKIYDEEILK